MAKHRWATVILITFLLSAFNFAAEQSSVQAGSSGDDWPMFSHDPQHTGYSGSSVPANPTLIWTFPNPNITSVPLDYTYVISTPVVSAGFLYISGANGSSFYCLNASTGLPIWSNPNIYVAASLATPAVYDDRIYIGVTA